MKRILLTITTALALAASFVAAQAEPFKVGFVYVGSVGDHGWTYQHDQGRKAVEAALGDKVKTSFVESVKEGADSRTSNPAACCGRSRDHLHNLVRFHESYLEGR